MVGLEGSYETESICETYTPQRSPRQPCRCSQSGLLPVGRTRRSGAWGRGIPWIRRILEDGVSMRLSHLKSRPREFLIAHRWIQT